MTYDTVIFITVKWVVDSKLVQNYVITFSLSLSVSLSLCLSLSLSPSLSVSLTTFSVSLPVFLLYLFAITEVIVKSVLAMIDSFGISCSVPAVDNNGKCAATIRCQGLSLAGYRIVAGRDCGKERQG